MVEINFNHVKPVDVITLRRIKELRTWHVNDNNTITIGSGVAYQEMEMGQLKELLPALAEAARTVGSPQIRAAGTLGGNLGTCSPAGDGLPVLFALDAIVHLQSLESSRDLSIHEFMLGVKRNARNANEIITGVTVPVLNGWQGYAKVGVRNAMVISVASACLAIDMSSHSVRIALGAVGPTIIRCRDAEAWIAQQFDLTSTTSIDRSIAQEFGRRVALESKPIDDHRSTAEYRRHAVRVLAQRLITRAYPS
jgi:CO/xanthine dehydrogenase FAD-binding subunit